MGLRIILCICLVGLLLPRDDRPVRLDFRMQEIDRTLKVGYAVITADVNGDGKPDIVVVDTNRVVWFENPTWKLHTILQGVTKPDNVCIAAQDIDGDGKIDFALGAEWKPFNTKSGGTLQWLSRCNSLDEPWQVHLISEDVPTIHRIRFADLQGTGKPQLLVAPLMGRGSSAGKNWSEQPVEVFAYSIPADPAKDRWPAELIDRSLHVVHNLHAADVDGDGKLDLLCASYEGVTLIQRGPSWLARRLGPGDQSQPDKSRGASEIRLGSLGLHRPYLATIEPWHGNQVVIYRPGGNPSETWQRQVIDKELKWGHALACADLVGGGRETLIVGVRDSLSKDHPCGVRLYHPNGDGTVWSKRVLDPGGVAVEDLTVADLNGDNKPDIIAVGRATGNVRIYWNEN